MSVTSKVTLGCAITFTTGMIAYVHLKQNWDRKKLHEGVVKDLERQQMKKMQNVKALQEQIELTKELKDRRDREALIQSVHTNEAAR